MGSRIRNHWNSLHYAGMLILFRSFLGIPPFHPFVFFHHFVPHVCPCIWHFENSSLSILQGLFLLLYDFSHESEHTKLMTLVIINLPFAVFYLQSRSCEVINKSQCDLKFFQQQLFLLCPPWPISMTLLFFKVFTLIFCLLIWKRQSFHTNCFWIFPAPVVQSILKIAVLRPLWLVSIV